MVTSSFCPSFPSLSLLLIFLLPHSMLKLCEATDNNLKFPLHHTPVSLHLPQPALPHHPLISPSIFPFPIKDSSLPPDTVSSASPSPPSLPPVTTSPLPSTPVPSSSPTFPSTPVPSSSPTSPSTPDALLSPGPSTPDYPSPGPPTPDHPLPVPSTPDRPSPGPTTPKLSTPIPKEGPPKTEGDEDAGASNSLVKGKKGKNGLLMVKHFYLWTRRNSKSSQLLDPSHNKTISDSSFRPRKTFVIIHGFLGWGTEAWILELKDKLLVTMNSNVISVDWPAGTAWWLPSYYTAVSRVPLVAKDLTALLRSLVTLWGLNLRDVHLVGHSLGAHIAGLASAPLSTVGRISGLDPAGLQYHGVPPSQRLDSSDADYVDVIHTNGCNTFNKWLDCYGINENLGHSDFWPNGGRHQPSCGSRRGVKNGEIGCSHEMAYVYYIESLNYNVDQTYFLARPCSSWDDFTAGNCSCGRETQYMGFSANMRLKGTFYLHTNSTSPYAEQDSGCLPGNATGSGVRLIEMALISSSALIATGAGIGAIALQVAKRNGTRRESSREGGSDSGVSVSSDVNADDCEALLP